MAKEDTKFDSAIAELIKIGENTRAGRGELG
jgi:hypothetical protein